MFADVHWTTILWIVIFAYAVSVAAFLILENRSPQSTFAWLFLLLIFPFGGLPVYFMFGRNRHAFSRERRLTKLIEGTALAERARKVMGGQPERLAQIRTMLDEYGRLSGMLWTTARSPLTHGNRVEIQGTERALG